MKSRTFKYLAKEAKKRMRSGYWECFDKTLLDKRTEAVSEGNNPSTVAEYYVSKTISEVNGKIKESEDFYSKVKKLLIEYGEVSDAIGRLIDKEKFENMTYDQKQRYTLEISNRYLDALERFRKEKEYGCINDK